MSLPQLCEKLPTLACNAVLVGHAQKSDVVWSRADFFSICEHMLNGNDPHFFMIPFRDEKGAAKFAKAKTARVDRRVEWAWDTITGAAKKPASIGFYPKNERSETRWACLDFDAHDGNAARARRLAMAAFDLLYRHPQFFVVLGTSGSSDGWHLFVFTREFHPCADEI